MDNSNKSECIGELSVALSALQGEIKDAKKDVQGYGYKYADLGQLLEISRPLLYKHNLSLAQLPRVVTDSDKIVVETLLTHKSGEWISSTIAMAIDNPPNEKGKKSMKDAQAIGSVISYARRYALAAMLGIAQIDDDGTQEPPIPKVAPQDKALLDNYRAILLSKLPEMIASSDVPLETIMGYLKTQSLHDAETSKLDALYGRLSKKGAQHAGTTHN